MVTRYNWEEIQIVYDAGASWRQLTKQFGVSNRGIQLAIRRGDLKTSRSASEGTTLSHASGLRKPDVWTPERRSDLSLRQSTANTGGRCKWFEVAGQKVQGTWERDFAVELERRQVAWRKPKVHAEVFHYTMDGKEKSYTPDFFLPDYNLYIEVKGHWWGRDKEKMDAVKLQHPNIQILIVEKQQFEDFMQGKQLW